MKKVSVCVPSYNAERFIEKTLRSILDSLYQDFEIIVNDDASNDNTLEIIKSLDDSRIKLYQNEENVGPVRNWNLAIKRATGEYVSLLNHDDKYGPFWLTVAVKKMEKCQKIGWVACSFRVIDEKGQTLSVRSAFNTGEIQRIDAFLELAKLNGLAPGFIARRNLLEEIGYHDEDMGPSADNDLFLRLAVRSPLFYFNFPHTARRIHGNNLVYRWRAVDQTIEGFKILDKVFNYSDLPDELRYYKNSCLDFYYHKSKAFAERYRDRGDLETYRQILHILELRDQGF
jgi:glycosyltransferase involved in cell wall biosynthesis